MADLMADRAARHGRPPLWITALFALAQYVVLWLYLTEVIALTRMARHNG